MGCAAAISCEARSPSGPANHVLRRYPASVGVMAMSIMSLPGPVSFVSTNATANAPAFGSMCEAMLQGEALVSEGRGCGFWPHADLLANVFADGQHSCEFPGLTCGGGRRGKVPCPCLEGRHKSRRVSHPRWCHGTAVQPGAYVRVGAFRKTSGRYTCRGKNKARQKQQSGELCLRSSSLQLWRAIDQIILSLPRSLFPSSLQ
jgi:hypothetical protein